MSFKVLVMFLLCFFSFMSLADNLELQNTLPNSEKIILGVQKTFPRYRVHFNHQVIQKEVYDEFIKELKEGSQSTDTLGNNPTKSD